MRLDCIFKSIVKDKKILLALIIIVFVIISFAGAISFNVAHDNYSSDQTFKGPVATANEEGDATQEEASSTLLEGFLFNYKIPNSVTSIVFSFEEAPENVELADLSAAKDNSIVGWLDGTTYTVSTQKENMYIQGNLNSAYMFYEKPLLETIDFKAFKTDNIQDMTCMFFDCISLGNIDISNWNVSKVRSFSHMFATSSQNSGNMKFTKLDVSDWNTISATDMNSMFFGCGQLTELDLSKWDVSKVTTFDHMFADCYKLQNIDMTNWNTDSLEVLCAMFNDCQSLKTIDVSYFDTQKVITFSQMFECCTSLEEIIGLENLDTSNANNAAFYEMFNLCSSLKKVNISNFVTDNADNMSKMFNGCKNITSLDLTNFNTVNVNSMDKMFTGMSNLQEVKVGSEFHFIGDTGNSYLPIVYY